MLSKRISAIILLLTIFCVPVLVLLQGADRLENSIAVGPGTMESGSFMESVEGFFQEFLPMKTLLKQVSIDLKLGSGQTEQEGIFLSEDMLIENLEGPEDDTPQRNTEAIQQFVGHFSTPTYAMIIPTACAIKQQELPNFVTTFNQKSFIDSVYTQFSGRASVVDVYPVLYDNRDEYIYYRTQSNLTGLGGYYLYSVLARRLGQNHVWDLKEFEMEHVDHDFRGDIYTAFPYQKIPPDTLTLYHFIGRRREYQVTHTEGSSSRVYYSLYPRHTMSFGDKMDVFLGGMSAQIDIHTASSYTQKLLIFGDETAQSYLPFLAVHYGDITLVDLAKITDDQLAKLRVEDYDQVLFAYSTDTYLHSPELGRVDLLCRSAEAAPAV